MLNTVSTLRGFNRETKLVTQQNSLFHAAPLSTLDDNDVEIAYEYDLLGRVIKETVAPNSEQYKASRTYSYVLTGGGAEQPIQYAIDVKGVETRTWLDGLNRVVKEERRDADALGGDSQAYRETYRAIYNNRQQMISETVTDWEREKDVPLTSRFNYDDWGEQRSVIRPDGVEEHEVSDPIRLTVTQWLDGMGKTVTRNNLFEKPENVSRYQAGVDPDAADARPYSEHEFHYDGLGRTAEEFDAVGNWTRYEYDAFDRMTKTVLPDENAVEREYAVHSSEDLPIKISVNGNVLGEQEFDGLDRMTVSITGGRKSVYAFDPGQRQPKSVTRPSGVDTHYVYRPELGEEPEQRIAVESTADYTYDGQNARLIMTEEIDEAGITHSLVREYFSTGELKLEERGQTGEKPLCMYYEYSRQARLISYTDVLGNTQTYDYDDHARLIATQLGSTRSTFVYNELGQLQTIETIDGQQRLKIDLEYDDFGREVLRKFDLGNQIFQRLSQAYDEVDRLTRRVLTQGTKTVLRDESYQYDVRGRLVAYTCSGSQPPVDPYGKVIQSQLFSFDAQDNIDFLETRFEGGTHSIFFEYFNVEDPCQLTGLTNQLTPAEPDNPNYPERIDFTHDADGNLLLDEFGRLLGYDSLGRLITVSELSGEKAIDYSYDTLDALSGSSSGSGNERRFYRNGELANQIQGDDSSTFLRGEGVVLAEHQAGAGPKSLLLASDDKNSVLSEVTRDGAEDIAYSPYGHCPDDLGGSSRLGYNGELKDMQTGWYLLGNGYRAFNPLLMRFHSPDSWSPFGEGGVNTYMYCLGNPIKHTDPTGHGVGGSFLRFFGIATKANKVAQTQASEAVANIAKEAQQNAKPLVLNAVDTRPMRNISTAGKTVTVKTLEHNLIAKSNREIQVLQDKVTHNNKWLMEVNLGERLAKPKQVSAVVAQNAGFKTSQQAIKAAALKEVNDRPPTFDTATARSAEPPTYKKATNIRKNNRKPK
ncbi:RHS repeat-associated core domain-containing protein [Pseudomonas serbica]|uniref:RHS repeat-associated core domain-containing protein n=1 Tax=Pseudomonas serbica TaxID=2965074 RepID=UPI00237C1B0D|nr:RHS repeat-associated core domain-containing protein [Pseudomonas serbica]